MPRIEVTFEDAKLEYLKQQERNKNRKGGVGGIGRWMANWSDSLWVV